jgi:hypothetical protein
MKDLASTTVPGMQGNARSCVKSYSSTARSCVRKYPLMMGNARYGAGSFPLGRAMKDLAFQKLFLRNERNGRAMQGLA